MATNNHCIQDVADAQLLASYLARNGVQGVETEMAVVAAIDTAAEVPKVPETFYASYQKLAAKALPVTVASLRDSTSRLGPMPIRAANLLAGFATLGVFLCLYILGHFHSNWLTMSDLNSRLSQLPQPLPPATRALIEKEIARLQQQIQQTSATEPSASYQDLFVKIKKLQSEIEQDKLVAPQRQQLAQTLDEAADRTYDDLTTWAGLLSTLRLVQPAIARVKQTHDVVDTSNTQLKTLRMLSNLQKVILPMLYGFLGSIVFVLRRVAKDSAERLFRRETTIEHIVRPLLGAVAGFIVGWFMSPEKAGVIADPSVAPFALAFVAGYSLEVLFTLLDRMAGSKEA